MTKEKCRLCLSSLPVMSDIFSLTKGVQNSILIKMFFGIEIDHYDALSKNVCRRCVQDLEYIYSNKLKYETNQEILERELHTQEDRLLPNGTFKINTRDRTHSPLKAEQVGTSFDQNESFKHGYIKVREDDLLQLCNAQVSVTRYNTELSINKVRRNGLKHRRKTPPKYYPRRKQIIDYYYHKNTKSLRTLFTKRLNEISAHSRSLHEDIYDFRISIEDRKKLCSIEKWNNISANFLDIKMEHNIFMCTFCCRMFNTKWMLRVHEQKHNKFAIKEYEPKSRAPSPFTII